MSDQHGSPASSSGSNNGLAATPQEELLVTLLGLAALTATVGSAGVFWLQGAAWLIQHGVLVAAAADPLLVLPGTDGAGMDAPRVAIAAGALLALLAWAISAVRRVWSHRQEQR